MKYSELEKKLKKAGCYQIRAGSNHPIWYSPITERSFPTSNHKGEEVKKGTLSNIISQSGVKI